MTRILQLDYSMINCIDQRKTNWQNKIKEIQYQKIKNNRKDETKENINEERGIQTNE